MTYSVLFAVYNITTMNRMVYPTFYLVYVCVTVVFEGEIATFNSGSQTPLNVCWFAAPFLIVGTLFKAEVFCGSDNLIESTMNSTPFCAINGRLRQYIALCITTHAGFPRQLNNNINIVGENWSQTKFIHTAIVLNNQYWENWSQKNFLHTCTHRCCRCIYVDSDCITLDFPFPGSRLGHHIPIPL